MIANFLLEYVSENFILPNETLVTYSFSRKLNRARDTYSFLLTLELENEKTGVFFERAILLGTNYRK